MKPKIIMKKVQFEGMTIDDLFNFENKFEGEFTGHDSEITLPKIKIKPSKNSTTVKETRKK